MDAEALVEGLTSSQREAVTTDGAPVCILAGPGSGKTRVITRRIAYRAATGSLEPSHVLAVTFTRKAADEVGGRLAGLGVPDTVTAGTFHALALAALRQRWADHGEQAMSVLDRPARLVAKVIGASSEATEAPVDAVVAEIEWAKARVVAPAAYAARATAAGRRPPVPAPVVASLYERYEEEKRRRKVVDFADLLLGCVRAIEDDPDYAAAQRWRFRHVFVDELQDINPLQWRLIEAWRGDRSDLCVVGDPHQAIYGWNGADPAFLEEFPARHPGTTVVRLDENFRSTPEISAVADAALGLPAPSRSPSRRSSGPRPTVTAHRSDRDELRGVVRAVRDQHEAGLAWTHMAVLARTRSLAGAAADALRAADVPCRLGGDGERTGGGRAVDVTTFHAAKGLEWPVVFVIGVEEGFVPSDRSADVAEERRLLYVALTRAERELHCSWAQRRQFGSRLVARQPSAWLAGVERAAEWQSGTPVPAEWQSGTPVPAEWRSRLAEQRERLEAPAMGSPTAGRPVWSDGAPPDRATRALVAALRAWRAQAARAAGVSPTAIAADRTLAAVAAVRPAHLDDLRAITGLGPVKAARFGPALLRVVARQLDQDGTGSTGTG